MENSTHEGSSRPRLLAPAPYESGHEVERALNLDLSITPPTKLGIKRASTACTNCQQIKRKCDQTRPCSNCTKTGTDCIYDQDQDGRRRAARRKTVEGLEHKRDALEVLLEALRDIDGNPLLQLLQMIKNDLPLNDIISYATEQTQLLREELFAASVQRGEMNIVGRSVLSIDDMCESNV